MSTGKLDLTIQDKVRLALNAYGDRYVPLTVAELAAKIGVPRNYDVYQALSRLRKLGELELEKENNHIIGIKINKLEPSGRTYQRAAERAKVEIHRISEVAPEESIIEGMTALKEYLNKKLAILDMQAKAREAGLDPETTIKFDPNPYAEEGLVLLKLLGENTRQIEHLKKELQMATFDLEAERRNVGFLQQNRKNETRRDLVASATAN